MLENAAQKGLVCAAMPGARCPGSRLDSQRERGRPPFCLHGRGGSEPLHVKPALLQPNEDRLIGIRKLIKAKWVQDSNRGPCSRESAEQFNTPFHENCPLNLTSLFFKGQGFLVLFFPSSTHTWKIARPLKGHFCTEKFCTGKVCRRAPSEGYVEGMGYQTAFKTYSSLGCVGIKE